MASAELDELIVADAEALRAWLSANHATSPGVWLALTRKGGIVTTLTWQQAVDEALCFGWIDGQARKRDQETSWIRFTPRRPCSSWSQRNVAHVGRLEAQGRMLPPGRAAVDAAKADGRWAAAYAPSSEAEAPADLLAAITAVPAAQAMFDVLTQGQPVRSHLPRQWRQTGADSRTKDRRVRRHAGAPRDDLPAEGHTSELAVISTFTIKWTDLPR